MVQAVRQRMRVEEFRAISDDDPRLMEADALTSPLLCGFALELGRLFAAVRRS